MPTPRSIVLACVALTAIRSVALAQAPATTYDVLREEHVMVPMRDGVRLSTDLYRPARGRQGLGGPFPALLLRTPYDKGDSALVRQARAFAARGYVVALQNIRGRYRSEGVFTKYSVLDAPDGYDAIEWMGTQPWSNGRVGTWGRSYAAHTQADAAKLNPPHLRTMVINQGGMSNAWDHAVRQGGAFELGRELTWALQESRRETSDPVARQALEQAKVEDWYTALPLRKGTGPLRVVPEYEAYFLDELTNADYGPFWQRLSLNWKERYAATSDVPMLHVGGWYDIFLRGTIDNFLGLRARAKAPVRMLIGPWVHGGNARTWAGDVDFGPGSAVDGFDVEFHLRWFDHFLKDAPNGVDSAPPARLFVMGGGSGAKDPNGRLQHGGRWIDATGWPLPGTTMTKYYLRAPGSLSTEGPGLRDAPTTFTFDPSHPVPTIGGSVSNRVKDGAYHQRERPDFAGSTPPFLPLRARRDVLVFQTEPLAEDVQVIGPIEVHLHASSTGVDTDFTAKLIDVYPPSAYFPDGFDLNLTDAILRASYRDDRLTRSLITPGRIYPLLIRPFPTANVFKKGHRIRLDISSSNFPRFDVNPNTGEPLGMNRRLLPVENTIFHDSLRPSHVLLPVVPQ